MKKSLLTFILVLSIISFVFPTQTKAQQTPPPPKLEAAPQLPPQTTAALEKFKADEKKANNDGGSQCGVLPGNWAACVEEGFFKLLELVGNFILSLVSWILWLAGTTLNLTIITLVIHMKDLVYSIDMIFVIWKTLRDLANMFFIFILLVIAIQTILQTGDYKKILRNVILVALFINFSFFFTGALIDVSNTMALMFYKGFSNESCTGSATFGQAEALDGCMSYKVVQSLKLQTIYMSPTEQGLSTSTNTSASLGATAVNSYFALQKFLLTVIAGSILMIVLAGVFFASAILLFYRFVELIMLLMLSPLAFAAIILPNTKTHWNTWWSKLTKQLIFAPVYFMFLWISMTIITSPALAGALRIANGDFHQALKGNMLQMFGLLANYIIVITLLGYSMWLANELGAKGTETATKAMKGFQGFVGRNTVGKAAYSMANSKTMRDLTASNPTLAKMISAPLNKAAGYGYGTKLGYDKAMEKRKKAQIETAKFVSETGLLVQRKGESNDDFEKRQTAEKEAGKMRKAEYNDALGGLDNTLFTKLSNKLGITAALRSNKEAHLEVSKQISKDNKEDKAKADKKAELAAAEEQLTTLKQRMKHAPFPPPLPGTLTPEEALKAKKDFEEQEEERIQALEDERLAQIEVSLTKTNIMDAARVALVAEKKKLERDRKNFEKLKNKVTSISDKMDRDRETDKISSAVKDASKPTPPPAPPAPTS